MGLFNLNPVKKLINKILHGSYDERNKALEELKKHANKEEAIPILIKEFPSIRGSTALRNAITDALAAIGTIAVIDPLLEMFRSAKPSKITENGFISREERGDDCPIALKLAEIPVGIEKLRLKCSPDEYERILVCAHDYGAMNKPEVNRALGDLGTSRSIGRLIFVLQQDFYTEEMRAPAIEALKKIGKKAHPQLIAELERKIPANRIFQTNLRKNVLEVLKESGDDQSIEAIKAVMDTDGAVFEEAKAAIVAIASRYKGIDLPKVQGPIQKSLKMIAKTGDPYIDACFQIEFPEFDEVRVWSDIPEAKAIPQAHNAGKIEEALNLIESLRAKYPDFYFPYYWSAVIFNNQNKFNEAREALNDGLNHAKSKYSLCSKYGDTEWATINLPEAVKWWIKSVIIQISTENLADFAPFLYLSYVAEQLGLNSACSRLRLYVDKMRIGGIRFNADAANELYSATRRQGMESIKQSLALLDREYLAIML